MLPKTSTSFRVTLVQIDLINQKAGIILVSLSNTWAAQPYTELEQAGSLACTVSSTISWDSGATQAQGHVCALVQGEVPASPMGSGQRRPCDLNWGLGVSP